MLRSYPLLLFAACLSQLALPGEAAVGPTDALSRSQEFEILEHASPRIFHLMEKEEQLTTFFRFEPTVELGGWDFNVVSFRVLSSDPRGLDDVCMKVTSLGVDHLDTTDLTACSATVTPLVVDVNKASGQLCLPNPDADVDYSCVYNIAITRPKSSERPGERGKGGGNHYEIRVLLGYSKPLFQHTYLNHVTRGSLKDVQRFQYQHPDNAGLTELIFDVSVPRENQGLEHGLKHARLLVSPFAYPDPEDIGTGTHQVAFSNPLTISFDKRFLKTLEQRYSNTTW